jgi:polyphosphate kinase 2 (PPK2 family)
VAHLPAAGEIVFFDRSWYNRAIVEPVLGFCTPEQYERFMDQVTRFEDMLVGDGVHLLKLWFSIDKDTQRGRLEARRRDDRRRWKLSPVDGQAQERWDDVTRYKEAMFERTSTETSPWFVVQGGDKYRARVEAIRTLLARLEHEFEGLRCEPDPAVVSRVPLGGR